jgi:prephenate dehydrogenase/chorismate mutase
MVRIFRLKKIKFFCPALGRLHVFSFSNPNASRRGILSMPLTVSTDDFSEEFFNSGLNPPKKTLYPRKPLEIPMTFAPKAKGPRPPLAQDLKLEDLRQGIDRVDQQLFALLKERAQLVFSVGEYKRARNLPIYDPAREGRIRQKVRQAAGSEGPLSPSEMEALFMTVVERFRFLEGAHVQKAQMEAAAGQAHLDFSRSQTVALCGFGLLGASFYLALSEVLPHWRFEVVDPGLPLATFMQWKEEHHFLNLHFISDPLHMHPASIYVLAASVEINARYLQEFPFPEDSLVLDLGSTKEQMQKTYLQRQKEAPHSFVYVGGHPLAGKEVSGFQSADGMLFYNKVFCWTALDSIHETYKATCEALALALGARPFWTSAQTHDQALAWTSHLPQILSSVMATCLKEQSFAQSPEFFPGVISDLLRVSGSSFSIWESILQSNHSSVQKALAQLVQELQACQGEVPASTDHQRSLFSEANQFYNQFQSLKQKKGAS